MFSSLDLGLGLLFAGLIFALLVWGLSTVVQRGRSKARSGPEAVASADSKISNDAVFLIQPGGRVEYVNEPAREWFGLRENDPADLERLVRRVRPPDEFLDLCAAPGQKRLTINGNLTDVTSCQLPHTYPKMLISLRGIDLAASLGPGQSEFSAPIVRVITEFNQSIGANLGIESVIHSILENVSQLIVADQLDLKAWDCAP